MSHKYKSVKVTKETHVLLIELSKATKKTIMEIIAKYIPQLSDNQKRLLAEINEYEEKININKKKLRRSL